MVEISSPNPIYLRYNGFAECLQLDYVPLLSELPIGCFYCDSFILSGVQVFIKYISQLKRLKLDIFDLTIGQTEDYLLNFPQLIKLEQLEAKVKPDWTRFYLWLIMLIRAAPSLQKFSVKLNLHGVDRADPDLDEVDYYKTILKAIGQVRHPNLKLIEMLKFSGSSFSPLLEQFVVSRFYLGSRRDPHALLHSPIPIEEYRMQAQKFEKWLPPTAKLVIL